MRYEFETFHIALCDDERECTVAMEKLIHECCKELKIKYEVNAYGSGEELLSSGIETDLLFLDVKMEGMDGLQVKDELRRSHLVKKIVFITSYAECMQTAFGLKVIGFECKPVSKEIIKKWIMIALEELDSSWLTIPAMNEFLKISENEICYLKADRDYVKLYRTKSENPVFLTTSMKKCEQLFHTDIFLRVHKSYIVNMQFIQKINGNEIKLCQPQITIPVGRTYKKQVQERYNQYLKYLARRRMA